MDVHRARFVPYPLHPITSISFSRLSNNELPTAELQPALKLAIGRRNGTIELWNPLDGIWVQESILTGESSSVDSIVWTRDPDETDLDGGTILGQHRLFSISSSPTVTEWDLELGIPKRRSTGNFSEVWCLAAQPRSQQQPSTDTSAGHWQELVAGCGDGSVVLFSTTDHDLQFKRYLVRGGRGKAKCVSIAYQNQHRVLAGCVDSTIRVYDTKTASNIRTMSLGVGIPGAPKDAVVWQVKALPNGNIVSGDSNGEIVFWDGRSYSLTQRIKGHNSECLDVVTSSDGKTVLSGSMDGRIAIYRQSLNGTNGKSWSKIRHRKTHGGEIKAMSAFDSSGLSVIASGGNDLVPIITPLRENGRENVRALPAMPQFGSVASARHARLLASWWDRSISIWRIERRSNKELSLESQSPCKLVAKLSLKGTDPIRDISLSPDGKVIAACTVSEIKLFQLRRRPHTDTLSVRKISLPVSLASEGARMIEFSPNGKWLALMTLHGDVRIARLGHDESQPKHVRVMGRVAELERMSRPSFSRTSFERHDLVISRAAFASDSSVLVVADMTGHLDSWILAGEEDSTAPEAVLRTRSSEDGRLQDSESPSADSSDSSDDDEEEEICMFHGQYWMDNPVNRLLPQLDSTPLILSFRPGKSQGGAPRKSSVNGVAMRNHNQPQTDERSEVHNLWVMTAQHQMYEFDISTGKLSDWSRRNPTSVLPDEFTRIKDRAMGAIWDIRSSHQRLWLYGSSWMFMLNVGKDLMSAIDSTKKRKSTNLDMSSKRLRPNSGAGDRKHEMDREGIARALKSSSDGVWTKMSLEPSFQAEEGEDESSGPAAAQLRLTRAGNVENDGGLVPGGDGPQSMDRERRWYYVFKYRPILGVAQLEDDDAAAGGQPLEVVVVERPLWDAREASND